MWQVGVVAETDTYVHPVTNTSPLGFMRQACFSLLFLASTLWANSPIPFILSSSFFKHQQDAGVGGSEVKTFFGLKLKLKLAVGHKAQ